MIRRLRSAVVAVAAAAALAAGCGPGRLVRQGQVNDDAMAWVRRRLVDVRGLSFRAPVPAQVLDREALRDMLAREIELSYRPDDLERLEAVYTRLGLLPPGTKLRAVLQRLYEAEGAGFYDPRTKRLMLAMHTVDTAAWWTGLVATVLRRDLVGEMVVAHELTHALQDQRWSIPSEPDPLLDAQGDRLLARRALLEGDATLAAFACLGGATPEAGTIRAITEELHSLGAQLAARYPDVPDAVRATVAFEYDEGTTFAAWALASGGWAAVDRAQAEPPASTEQVLHPARYYGHRDEPVVLAVGGTEELEAAGWTRTLEDTLGELSIRLLARRSLPAARAAEVADGWGGDRLRALARDGELVLVWVTAWDSPADAEEFAAAMPEVLPGARIDRREMRVLVLLGPDAGPRVDIDRLAGAVWRWSGAAGVTSPAGRRTPRPPARRSAPAPPRRCRRNR
jgi:hypothetical protein